MSTVMTISEQERRDALENELDAALGVGRQAYLTVGRCLAEILDSRLYRSDYTTFEDYCTDFWGFSESLARRWADAYRVAKNLTADEEECPLLTWDALIGFQPAHAAVLKRLPADRQVEAWTAAKAVTPTPTAAMLDQVVKKHEAEFAAIDGMTKEEELKFQQTAEKEFDEAYIATKRVAWASMAEKKLHGILRGYDERFGFVEEASQVEMLAGTLGQFARGPMGAA